MNSEIFAVEGWAENGGPHRTALVLDRPIRIVKDRVMRDRIAAFGWMHGKQYTVRLLL